ncbi:MAG: Peptidase M24 [Candidatus Gottesmanbacteria bacterium GW2011_GWB1_43_11]|uniref:Peptidase M24 n=1 Tax=Candidatus Gottesmanbacteria bacterium GW2011_GWB1_43_11 TaxID=1618446 RepID=A0A0G1CMC6_9BACT|nr:MAG: Peptidase M24 [Candidatus Gottesmanbacteria bacterium GW2011_GWB1_43_11]
MRLFGEARSCFAGLRFTPACRQAGRLAHNDNLTTNYCVTHVVDYLNISKIISHIAIKQFNNYNSLMLQSLDALLVTDPTNIYYLTGFMGLAPDEREAYVLVTQDKLYLFTNPLYREQAEKIIQLPNNQINTNNPIPKEYIEISRENPLAIQIKKVLDALSLTRTIKVGFEENNLTVAEMHALKKDLDGFNLVPTRNRIEELRKFKRPDEIAQIKSACKLTDNCFDFILTKLIPGVTETEIAWEIESYFKKRGAENAFPPIVAFGKNSSQPHYSSSIRYTLDAKRSLVLLDFGARVNGYCADMTRMLFMGLPKTEWKKAYQALKLAQQKALSYLAQSFQYIDILKNQRRKISGAELDQLVRKELAKFGYPPYPHSLGHAVGLAIHEAPRLSIRRDEELKPGMIFSVEPGIYVPGQFGMRIEDLVLLTENGIEVLSKSTKEMMIL